MNNEIIINQQYKYAVIELYRGYTNIFERPSEIKVKSTPYVLKNQTDEIARELLQRKLEEESDGVTTLSGDGLNVKITRYDPKNPKFFYDNIEKKVTNKVFDHVEQFTNVTLSQCGFLSNGDTYGTYFTDNVKHIEKYRNDPLAQIRIISIERSIIRKGDNVIIKLEKTHENRTFNHVNFTTQRGTSAISFNSVTNNFIISRKSLNGFEGVTPIMKTNSFRELMLYFFNSNFTPLNDVVSPDNPLFRKYLRIFNGMTFLEEFNNALNINLCFYPKRNIEVTTARFCYNFITKRNIKVPNHYMGLLLNYYPSEKVLKKNGRKLIASILDYLEIKSKVTIKKVHENPDIDLHALYFFCKIFGDDYPKYIGNISFPTYKPKRQQDKTLDGVKSSYHVRHELSKKEKDNVMKLVLLGIDDFMPKLTDHLAMLDEIKPFRPDMGINAMTMDSFEHEQFSKLRMLIKRNTLTQYMFNRKLVEKLEEPIKLKFNDEDYEFFPYLLKREDEYEEEGKTMHHCVFSYVNKESSVIVSLRNEDKTDRVTAEFKVDNGTCVQCRYFSNRTPPDYYQEALTLLKKRMESLSQSLTLKYIKKERTPIAEFLND